MNVKDHKFQCSPREVCATLMLISSEARRIDQLFAGVVLDYNSFDQHVLQEALIILDKYVLPKIKETIRTTSKPKAITVIEDMKLAISDVIFEIKESQGMLSDFTIRFSMT